MSTISRLNILPELDVVFLRSSPHLVFPLLLIFADNIDRPKLQALFDEYDVNKDGVISVVEVEKMLAALGVAPLTEVSKMSSASSDKGAKEEA